MSREAQPFVSIEGAALATVSGGNSPTVAASSSSSDMLSFMTQLLPTLEGANNNSSQQAFQMFSTMMPALLMSRNQAPQQPQVVVLGRHGGCW